MKKIKQRREKLKNINYKTLIKKTEDNSKKLKDSHALGLK